MNQRESRVEGIHRPNGVETQSNLPALRRRTKRQDGRKTEWKIIHRRVRTWYKRKAKELTTGERGRSAGRKEPRLRLKLCAFGKCSVAARLRAQRRVSVPDTGTRSRDDPERRGMITPRLLSLRWLLSLLFFLVFSLLIISISFQNVTIRLEVSPPNFTTRVQHHNSEP